MEDKDILGKEFICCKFNNTDKLKFTSGYEDIVGCTSTVLSIHDVHKEYALIEITLKTGTKITRHFPVDVIKQQIQEKESTPVGYYFDEIKKILALL
jgi:hypothetical protein